MFCACTIMESEKAPCTLHLVANRTEVKLLESKTYITFYTETSQILNTLLFLSCQKSSTGLL